MVECCWGCSCGESGPKAVVHGRVGRHYGLRFRHLGCFWGWDGWGRGWQEVLSEGEIGEILGRALEDVRTVYEFVTTAGWKVI